MPIPLRNPYIFHKVVVIVLLVLLVGLAGCDMPDHTPGIEAPGLTTMADRMHAAGDDAGAVEFYQRELQRKPNDIVARKNLGEILEAHGDNANASMEYREALKIKPDDGELWRALGRTSVARGQYAEAKEAYEKSLVADPDNVKGLNGLGVTLDYLGQHDTAQKAYQAGLEKEPDNFSTLSNLGHSYVLSGGYDEAIQLLEPHVNDKGVTPALRQNLAEAYGMSGMMPDAERMARMDLTPQQVKHNLDFYRTRRTQLSLVPSLYADLGSYPTDLIANAHVETVKDKFPKELDGLILTASSEVKEIGSTPSFNVRVTGFVHAEKLRAFCEKLKKEDIPCQAHEK